MANAHASKDVVELSDKNVTKYKNQTAVARNCHLAKIVHKPVCICDSFNTVNCSVAQSAGNLSLKICNMKKNNKKKREIQAKKSYSEIETISPDQENSVFKVFF